MGTLLMGRSRKKTEGQSDGIKPPAAVEPAPAKAEAKKQIWVYMRDARDVGLLTSYLNKAQPDVFEEVLRKTLMERVALERLKAEQEDAACG